MAYNTSKTTTQRSWPLEPVEDGQEVALWAVHTVTVKDTGLPTESTNHEWTLEARFPRPGGGSDTPRSKIVLAVSAGQAEFDNALNIIRQAMVDARAGLGTM